MKDDGRLVTVEINGLRYPIRSHLDAAYVADLAAYVEQKMQLRARKESPAGDTLKIAVLAALNIADECFRARARKDGAARPASASAPANSSGCSTWRSARRAARPQTGRIARCPDRRFISKILLWSFEFPALRVMVNRRLALSQCSI